MKKINLKKYACLLLFFISLYILCGCADSQTIQKETDAVDSTVADTADIEAPEASLVEENTDFESAENNYLVYSRYSILDVTQEDPVLYRAEPDCLIYYATGTDDAVFAEVSHLDGTEYLYRSIAIDRSSKKVQVLDESTSLKDYPSNPKETEKNWFGFLSLPDDDRDCRLLTVTKNGDIYFYTKEEQDFQHNTYSVYVRGGDSDCDKLLYQSEDVPGQAYYTYYSPCIYKPYPDYYIPGISYFTVRNNTCYFSDMDNGKMCWFSFDLSNPDHAEKICLATDKEYPYIFDYADVDYDADTVTCEKCGRIILCYYNETITLFKDKLPNAEKITAFLQKKQKNFFESEKNSQFLEFVKEGHICEPAAGSVAESYFIGATEYVFEVAGQKEPYYCLETDFEGSLDGSGAHGNPFYDIYFFNLNDGTEITIRDICGISEEDFRTLAAEYTAADAREKKEKKEDYPYFADMSADNEEKVYKEAYDTMKINHLMRFGRDGVEILYSPYEMGSFTAGFIPVTIPYEEFGMKLISVKGLHE